MEHAVFFSRTHGCGKTTTIDQIRSSLNFEMFFSGDGDHGNPYVNPYHRQIWRLNKHYLDSLNIFERQNNVGASLLLVDRYCFDYEAYTKTFHILGWLTDEQYDKLEQLNKAYFYREELLPKNIVLFFPPEN